MNTNSDIKTIAVIIGRGGYNEMGLIRSCGEADMDVVLVAPKEIVIPIYKSRYVNCWIDRDITTSNNLIETIKEIFTQFTRYTPCKLVVFPSSDLISLLLDKNYKELSQFAIIPHAKGNLEELMDKANMAQMARECKLNVPNFRRINLKEQPNLSIIFPCIVKPLRSVAGEKGDISICRNNTQFKKAIGNYTSKGFYEILVQDLVEGNNQEEIAITGVCTPSGKIITEGMIHKKRIRGNGSTVFATFRNETHSELRSKIIDFIKKTEYKGIFDIEFLKNDMGYHFIECNFRNGAYGYAITKAGFNMPSYFTESKESNSFPQIHKVTFMEERSDFLNVLDHTITLFQWIRDIIRTNVFLWWNWRDPKPMLRIPHFLKAKFK